jgi:hypothetical protein
MVRCPSKRDRQTVEHRLAHERVTKRQARSVAEDIGADQFRREPRRGLRLDPSQSGRLPKRHAIPEHRHRPGQIPRAGIQAVQARAHDPRDARRRDDRHLLRRRSPVQGADQLPDEQRVASGAAVSKPHRGRIDRGLQSRLEQPADRRWRQRLGLEQPRAGRRRERIKTAVRAGRTGSRGNDEQDRQIVQSPRQRGQPSKRGLVRPLRVVDRQQQRFLLREPGDDPVQPMVQDVPRSGLLVGLRARRTEKDPRGVTLHTRERAPPPCRRGRSERRLQQLPHEPVGEPLLERLAAPPKPTQPGSPGNLEQGPKQRALADPRRTLDHDHPPRALPGRRHRVPQYAQLAIALHKTARSHRSERTPSRTGARSSTRGALGCPETSAFSATGPEGGRLRRLLVPRR